MRVVLTHTRALSQRLSHDTSRMFIYFLTISTAAAVLQSQID